MQDAALVAMRSEVVAEVTKLRNQELEQAQQQLREQLQQQVYTHFLTQQLHNGTQSHTLVIAVTYHADASADHAKARANDGKDTVWTSAAASLACVTCML